MILHASLTESVTDINASTFVMYRYASGVEEVSPVLCVDGFAVGVRGISSTYRENTNRIVDLELKKKTR